jgi:adenylate cyclase
LASDGVYKLADFGLATGTGVGGLDAEDLTDSGEIVGTVRYLAPERAAGGDATVLTDLYALGVTLYELALGKHPVPKEDNPLRIAQRIVNEPLRPLGEALAGMPPTIAAWFDRLMAHDPQRRFASAAEALHALEPLDLPVAHDRRATTRRTARPGDQEESVGTQLMSPPAGAPQTRKVEVVGSGSGVSGAARLAGTNRPPSTAIAIPVSGVRPVPAALLRKPRVRFVLKLILAIWVFSSAATVVAGLAISHRAIGDQLEHFRNNLASAAAGAALLVDGDVHRRLALAGATADRDPAYAQIVADLRRFKKTHPEITYIYTYTKLPETDTANVVAFVVDASEDVDRNHNGVTDPDEIIAPPGKRYSTTDTPELLLGFDRPSADAGIVTDQWGAWLSGYAPIRDAQGRSTGLVGVDLAADHIARLENDFLIHSAVLLVSTLVAFLAGGVLVALRMRQPIIALQRGLLKVAQGDLDVKLDVRTSDEFQVLADTFTFMMGELRDAAAIRRAFEGFVAHSLAAQFNRHGVLPAPQGGLAARLYCDLDQGDGPLIDRAALGRVLSHVLPLLFEAVRAHQGVPERVRGTGVLITFPSSGPEDRPQARAVRAALAFLSVVENSGMLVRVAIGIDQGEDPSGVERRAVALGHFNRQMGTDLLVSSGAFLPIRSGFYADRLRIDAAGADLPEEGYAVKGAVSA